MQTHWRQKSLLCPSFISCNFEKDMFLFSLRNEAEQASVMPRLQILRNFSLAVNKAWKILKYSKLFYQILTDFMLSSGGDTCGGHYWF